MTAPLISSRLTSAFWGGAYRVLHTISCLLGTAIGSVLGCVFLMLSMVLVVEVKLGKLACGGDAVWAAIMLIVLVTTALVGYVSTTIYAFLDY
ncbi:hypothetical protein LguiB_030584 [Lonicera macranthoides]